LTWPYHSNLFFSMKSMMSGFPFTPVYFLPLYSFRIHSPQKKVLLNSLLYVKWTSANCNWALENKYRQAAFVDD
jgi:hypothetical protein